MTRILLVLFLSSLAQIKLAEAQLSITQLVGSKSTWKRPIDTAPEFIKLLAETRLNLGDGINAASFDPNDLSDKEYLHFYLLSRAARMGWFRPLVPDLGEGEPYGATPRDCSERELSLQSHSVAVFNQPVWCQHYQWKAAKWIFDTLNNPPVDNSDGIIAKLFFLAETAGGDLSALEVQNAVTGQYPQLKPAAFPFLDVAPYRSQIDTEKPQSTYEAWNSWANTPEDKLRSADMLFFYKQDLLGATGYFNAYGPFVDLRDNKTYSNIYISKKSQYFLGNELQLKGSFGLDYEAPKMPPLPPDDSPTLPRPSYYTEYPFAGPFIAVNSLTLDSLLSGDKYGLLTYSDFFQPPVIAVKQTGGGGGMVIVARSLTIGETILDRPERIWSTIGEKVYPTTGKCTLNDQMLGFALKQIAPNAPAASTCPVWYPTKGFLFSECARCMEAGVTVRD